jgi:hypothetical protein
MSNIRTGEYNTLPIQDTAEFGLFLGWDDDRVLLPKRYMPSMFELGQELRVFVYRDSEDRRVATTQTPHGCVGEFASVEIVDLTPHGAFAGWGLDKDLFIPFAQQRAALRIGDRHIVYISLHERTDRVIGSTDVGRYFDYDIEPIRVGTEVSLLVFGRNEVGSQVVVDNRYRGIVYHNEAFTSLKTGESLTGYVKALREDDRLDISLRRIGHDATLDAKDLILRALSEAGGRLSLHDKSPPEEIRSALGMSKKLFKRALGGLYRDRRVTLQGDGIELVSTTSDPQSE